LPKVQPWANYLTRERPLQATRTIVVKSWPRFAENILLSFQFCVAVEFVQLSPQLNTFQLSSIS
jgi:hypothetical protein